MVSGSSRQPLGGQLATVPAQRRGQDVGREYGFELDERLLQIWCISDGQLLFTEHRIEIIALDWTRTYSGGLEYFGWLQTKRTMAGRAHVQAGRGKACSDLHDQGWVF